MTVTTGTVPTTAERIRSACVRAQALIALPGDVPVAASICHLLPDGTVAVAVPSDTAAAVRYAAAPVPAMVELTDHAPLALRERVRALVWLRGHLQAVPTESVPGLLDQMAAADPDPALLQVRSPRSAAPAGAQRYELLTLATESAVLADTTGAESVQVADLLAARPDPFCALEAGWLHHLDTAHPEVVARLAGRLPARLRRGRPRPLGVDRHGIWLRVEDADGDHDVRLPFGRPVTDVSELNRAVRALMGCPFLNGLHARHR